MTDAKKCLNMFNENAWNRGDGFEFVIIQYFMCKEREWNDMLAINVISIALEFQNASPTINCKKSQSYGQANLG